MYELLVLDRYLGIPTTINISKSNLRFDYEMKKLYLNKKYKLLRIKKVD